MKRRQISILLAALGMPVMGMAETSGAPSYYEYESPAAPRVSAPQDRLTSQKRKSYVVEGDAGKQSGFRVGVNDSGRPSPQAGQQPALPVNMERGVKDLELGMDELRAYTAVMAAHIQQNGLRGFLAIPPDIRDQGAAVGKRIGGGINGIATDVAHDMVVPEKH